MKRPFIVGAMLVFILAVFLITKSKDSDNFTSQVKLEPENQPFTLKKGDILVRPNWSGFPGSIKVAEGRKFGHVAVVVEGCEGKSIDNALSNAMVIEALLFDQATRRYLFFKPENQIRESKAIVSFGNRFRGIRYRLRVNLTDEQINDIIQFLKNQTDCSYNLFSQKQFVVPELRKNTVSKRGEINWHCATLAWEAFYLATGTDIDANIGFMVYPSDLIASEVFNQPDARVRF